jgi:hypothetical protein
VFVRGADGARLSLTTSLGDNNIGDGASVVRRHVTDVAVLMVLAQLVTLLPPERKITIHLADDAGNELDMMSNNTVKVSSVLAARRSA